MRSTFLRILSALLFLSLAAIASLRAELRVSTDFEGGSATVDGIDPSSRRIEIRPGGDPARGWACWWFLRIDGLGEGEAATLVVRGSERPTRNNGKLTDKPLSANWAMPAAAAVSDDGKSWRHTALGTREVDRISYPLIGTGGPVWVAWGPPFTSRESEALFAAAAAAAPDLVSVVELARTREDRPVRALRVAGSGSVTAAPELAVPESAGLKSGKAAGKPVIWIQARQHAWESGSSWVARGFVDWLLGEEAAAVRLRNESEILVVPILDVDRVATGDGGKEADPRDHNRDWSDSPHYPEIAATQQRLRAFAAEGRLAMFLDLHNPSSGDRRPFFFIGPAELLAEEALARRDHFLALAVKHLDGPLALDPKPRVTGPGYHPLWRQMSRHWVNEHGNPQTVSACLETSWNTPHSTVEGYGAVGAKLGRAVAECLAAPLPGPAE